MEGSQTRALNRMDETRRFKEECWDIKIIWAWRDKTERDVYLKFFIRSDPFRCPSQFQGIKNNPTQVDKMINNKKRKMNTVWPHRSESLSYLNLCMYFCIHLIRILLFGPFKLMKDLIGKYGTKTFSFLVKVQNESGNRQMKGSFYCNWVFFSCIC